MQSLTASCCRVDDPPSPREALSEREPLVAWSYVDGEPQCAIQFEPHAHLDIVQMAAPIFYVEEEEQVMQVDVMRLGAMRGRCSAKFRTLDGSAQAGVRYSPCSGTLVFEDGEDLKTIKVPILDNKCWTTTQEFKVSLADPHNCKLGNYLHTCRVKVIDNDCFPSTKCAAHVAQGGDGIERMGNALLFIEYLRLVMSVPQIRWRILASIFLQSLAAVNVYLQLYLQVYLVDVVLEDSEEAEESDSAFLLNFGPHGGRTYTARLVACGFVLPSLLLWLAEYVTEKLDYKGVLDSYLTVNLFNKYLNFAAKSREVATASVVSNALAFEANNVTEGVVATMHAIQIFGKLLVTIVFAVKEAPNVLESTGVMFAAMIFGLTILGPKLIEKMEYLAMAMIEVTKHIQNTCSNYQLIADYKLRPLVCDMFKRIDEDVKHQSMHTDLAKLHLHRWAEMLGPLFIAWHIASKSHDVLSRSMSLGMFLASIRMFKELSEIYVELNHCLQSVTSSIAPLKKFTTLLNMETDLMQWKTVARSRRKRTKTERQSVLTCEQPVAQSGNASHHTFRTDKIKIELAGVEFSYPGHDRVLAGLNATTSQGSFIAVVGKHGQGKATLMKLLGHSIFPTEGNIFIPSHLRTLYVPQHLSMMEDSGAWSNLTFGLSSADPVRVRTILSKLNMPQTLELVIEELAAFERRQSGEVDCSGGHRGDYSSGLFDCRADRQVGIYALPHSEKAKVHLARALIMNPEVLVLQRPLSNFNDAIGTVMFDVIREHISNRGFALPESTCSERRPRTVFISPSSVKELRAADCIWEVRGRDGIRCYDSIDSITEDHLTTFHMFTDLDQKTDKSKCYQ